MAKYLAGALLCLSLSGCDPYAYQGFSFDAGSVANSDYVRNAAIGGLVGGAANYAIAANPIAGLAMGAATGAAVTYLNPSN